MNSVPFKGWKVPTVVILWLIVLITMSAVLGGNSPYWQRFVTSLLFWLPAIVVESLLAWRLLPNLKKDKLYWVMMVFVFLLTVFLIYLSWVVYSAPLIASAIFYVAAAVRGLEYSKNHLLVDDE